MLNKSLIKGIYKDLVHMEERRERCDIKAVKMKEELKALPPVGMKV